MIAGPGTRSSAERFPAMRPNLSNLELDILRKLAHGEAVSLSSHLRLRLELAGVIRDGAKGIALTAEGRRLAGQKPLSVTHEGASAGAEVAVDRRGRRMPLGVDLLSRYSSCLRPAGIDDNGGIALLAE